MISIIIKGGLGNQLFQIFHVISYCIKNNLKFVFPKNMRDWDKRKNFWDTIFKNLDKNTVKTLPEFTKYKEKSFNYLEIPKIEKNIIFDGYFQSYKYFKENFENITELIGIEKQKNIIKKQYNLDYENIISIHFRIGDYINLQNHHPIMTLEYYKDAIKYIIKKTNRDNLSLLVFFELKDKEIVETNIKKLKNIFPNIKFISSSNKMKDWEQLLQMSLCNNNIIANSTFSWWGAYFNNNKEKIVCYPNKWFGKLLSHNNTCDLHPKKWINI